MRPFDARLLPAFVAAVAIAVVGITVSTQERNVVDVDQILFERTLRSMRAGEGYYPAMRDAVAAKEGAPPSEVRAIRPPTEFLLLRWIPEGGWRAAAGLVAAVSLCLCAALGLGSGRYGPLIAVAGAGLWIIAAMPHLFLHAELWGLPLFLGGLLALKAEKTWYAVALLASAVVVRELYVIAFVVAAMTSRMKKPWVVGALALGALAAVHVALATGVLVETGHQVALGNEPRTLQFILNVFSPGDRPLAWVLGIPVAIAGAVGASRIARTDQAAKVVLITSVVLATAAILATRTYWSLAYAPALFCFVPTAFSPRRPSVSSGGKPNRGGRPRRRLVRPFAHRASRRRSSGGSYRLDGHEQLRRHFGRARPRGQ